MTEKAKLMTDEEVDNAERICMVHMPDPGQGSWLSALATQARLANAQAERLERMEGWLGHAVKELRRMESYAVASLIENEALSPSTTKGEG